MTDRSRANLARLVEQARAADASLDARQRAFTALVERSQNVVFAVALGSLRDLDEAMDVAQDAFATAWRRLPQLRDPSAFPAWMHAIVRRECTRHQRQRRGHDQVVSSISIDPDVGRLDYNPLLGAALDALSSRERDVTVLHYFLGYSAEQIAHLLRLQPGAVRKRLHSARLRIRARLPRSVRQDFVRVGPTAAFAERVRRGLLDDYVGDYRFDRRPEIVVRISREGDMLISESSGQRHVLVAGGTQRLLTYHYDGEGRFGRNRRGEITHFVYYEFGRRLGVARKLRGGLRQGRGTSEHRTNRARQH